MKAKTRISKLLLLIVIIAFTGSANTYKLTQRADVPKPNVIIIMADQWNAQSVGYAGNKDVLTPNIDRFANESLIFKNAVSVSPVCSPARASFLTGQFPTTHGVFYNDKPLSNSALTLAEIYKSVGYSTGYIGKWHLNGHSNEVSATVSRNSAVPLDRRQGFDFWKAREVTHAYNQSFYFDENDRKHFWEGYDAFPQTDTAINFINSNRSKPFLLFLSWGPPHDPYSTAPKEYKDLYDANKLTIRPNVPDSLNKKARKELAGYYAHCTALDKAFGKLVGELERSGLKENTIVVFTSDHGDMLYSQGKVRKQKPWDESALVPLLIRYPALFGHQKKFFDMPVSTIDMLPTILGLSKVPVPGSVQGQNLTRVLTGEEKVDKDRAALIQLPVPFHENNFLNGGMEYRAVRTARYTYAANLKGPWLLYDNQNDPFQLRNLVNNITYKEVQKKLEKTLSEKMKYAGDQFLSADYYMNKWGYKYDNNDSIRVSQ